MFLISQISSGNFINSAGAMFSVLVLSFSALSHVVVADSLVTTDGCGQSKGCLHYPVNCVSPNCDLLATWKNSSMNGYMDFELMAKTPGWVALGLSYNTLMVRNVIIFQGFLLEVADW